MAPVTDKSSRLASAKRIGVFVLLVVGLGALFATVATPWVGLSWWKVFRRCVSVASALSLWFVVTRLEGRSLRSYGFSGATPAKRQFWLGILLGVCSLLALLVIGFAGGLCRFNLSPESWKLVRTVVGFLPAAVLIGVLEELVFRGFLLQQLLSWSQPSALLISSLAYSLVHVRVRTMDVSIGLELIGLFLLGGLLALTYVRTKQLYLGVGLHAILAYGARINKLFLEFPDLSLAWLSGTNRLINGLLGWSVLLLAGAVMWRLTERLPRGGMLNANG